MSGRVIDAISERVNVVPPLVIWAGLGAFNIVAFVLGGARRRSYALPGCAAKCCSRSSASSTCRWLAPYAWHVHLAAYAAASVFAAFAGWNSCASICPLRWL